MIKIAQKSLFWLNYVVHRLNYCNQKIVQLSLRKSNFRILKQNISLANHDFGDTRVQKTYPKFDYWCFESSLVPLPDVCAAEADPAASMAEFCKKLPRADYQSLSQIAIESNWFEVYEVAPGVSAIYEPHQWQEVISYLIEGEQRALLFDTGNGIADIGKVVAGLTDKPVSVLNSHTHYDHVGGNFAFAKVYAMDTEFTRARQSGHPNQDIAIEASTQALCRPLPDGVTQQNHVGRPFKVTDFIQDGDQIDLGGRQLEVLHVPGHTPDAIALIDRAAGLMWTGDSYYSGPIWLFAPETDLDAFAKSLQRLIISAKGLKALLPAHNTPWVSPYVLPRVAQGLQAMLSGNSKAVPQGDTMVEHQIEGESEFSFLMRDEPIPYK